MHFAYFMTNLLWVNGWEGKIDGGWMNGWNTLTSCIAQVSKVGNGFLYVLIDGIAPPPPPPGGT